MNKALIFFISLLTISSVTFPSTTMAETQDFRLVEVGKNTWKICDIYTQECRTIPEGYVVLPSGFKLNGDALVCQSLGTAVNFTRCFPVETAINFATPRSLLE